jgi:hypothetical protein
MMLELHLKMGFNQENEDVMVYIYVYIYKVSSKKVGKTQLN